MQLNVPLREPIQQIQELYSKGTQSRSSRLSSRYIYSVLIKNRATVLRQQINKSQSTSEWSFQSLSCVDLVLGSIPNSDKKLLRTKNKIPTSIIGLNGKSLATITSLDGEIKFDNTTFNKNRHSIGDKYTNTRPSLYIRDQYGYVNQRPNLKGLYIYDLFYDPIEAYTFQSSCNDCVDCQCKDYLDYEFPLDGDTLNTVVKMAVNELIIMFSQMQEDTSNDARDDNEITSQMIHQPQQQPNNADD